MSTAARALKNRNNAAKGVSRPRQPPAKELLQQIRARLGDSWLSHIYRERILKMRTRAYNFPVIKKAAAPEIFRTLLGVEVKIGRRRLLCPDLPTARYLAVFARAACSRIAIPYDITKISRITDELESSWHRMLLLVETNTTGRSSVFRTRLRRLLIDTVRAEIANAGAGRRIPEFKQIAKKSHRNAKRNRTRKRAS